MILSMSGKGQIPDPRVIKENHTEDGLSETLCPEERETH